MTDLLTLWPLWLPIVIVFLMHAFEKSQSGVGYVYADDMPAIMRRRVQIFSFQSRASFHALHIKGSQHIDITEIDPDAFLLQLEKKYPVFCYCDDGVQSKRYFQHILDYQKAFWLVDGLEANKDAIQRYCTGEDTYV